MCSPAAPEAVLLQAPALRARGCCVPGSCRSTALITQPSKYLAKPNIITFALVQWAEVSLHCGFPCTTGQERHADQLHTPQGLGTASSAPLLSHIGKGKVWRQTKPTPFESDPERPGIKTHTHKTRAPVGLGSSSPCTIALPKALRQQPRESLPERTTAHQLTHIKKSLIFPQISRNTSIGATSVQSKKTLYLCKTS